jgi:SulP family sulfate permease
MKLPDASNLPTSVKNRLPEQRSLKADLIAGLTFALVNIPQAMANALLANVDPVRGLYTLMIGTPIGALFSGSVFMNVSTTSALSVAAGSALLSIPSQLRVQNLIILVLMVGVIQLLAGIFKLGTLMRFVSNAVMVGFTTGVSFLIILGQLSDLTGYDSAFGGKVASALDTLLRPGQWSLPSVFVGGLVTAIIFGLSRTRYNKIAYIIALAAGTLAGILINRQSPGLVEVIPPLPDQLFAFGRPNFQYLGLLLPSALGIAIIGLVQGAGVAQSFPNPDGRFGDVSRDFSSQGLANIATGLFSGIPGGGSMSGTALVVSTGAQTRWANILAGLTVFPLVIVFDRLFDLVPIPALAGLLIAVGLQSLRPDAIRTVWETNLPARLGMGLTLAATLIMPLQFAIFVGVAVSIMLHVLQSSSRVRLVELVPVEGGFPIEQDAPARLKSESVTILMPYGDLFFAAASTVERLLPEVGEANRAAVILTLRGREEIGSTFVGILRRYTEALQAKDGRLYLVGVSPTTVDQLRRTGLVDLIGSERIIPTQPQLGAAANQAVADAYAWLDKPVTYAQVPPIP